MEPGQPQQPVPKEAKPSEIPIPPVESTLTAPMGAHPPEAPHLDPVIVEAYEDVEPAAFRDHPESAVEAADIDVDDTIGAE